MTWTRLSLLVLLNVSIHHGGNPDNREVWIWFVILVPKPNVTTTVKQFESVTGRLMVVLESVDSDLSSPNANFVGHKKFSHSEMQRLVTIQYVSN